MTEQSRALVDTGSRLTHGRAVIDFAEEVGAEGPIAVVGGRTRWEVGGLPTVEPRLVSAPSGIVDYKPEEMVARVGAGTTVGELNAALSQHGQRSALPDRGGTVGGAVAVGENDRDVLRWGAVRNAVLQVTYVSAEGKVVSGGGPTVKNVSGFDLPRLVVGSLGTLGALAEVILRTNPLPAVSRWFRSQANPFDLYDQLLAPSCVLWDGSTTWILLEGYGPDVDAEAGRASEVGALTETEGPPDAPGPRRWSLPPGELRRFALDCSEPFLASIGVGTVLTTVVQDRGSSSPAVAAVHDRMKLLFDPSGRMNPGRNPEVR
ncbi:MAG: FAD-binding protein [Acidimicrobiales bacterium]|nr:FAD-binding protein [Acidimicrobiales bacterium]